MRRFPYGADAVDARLPRYSLQVRNNAFRKVECLREGIDEVHARGRKFLVGSKLLPHHAKVRSYLKDVTGKEHPGIESYAHAMRKTVTFRN